MDIKNYTNLHKIRHDDGRLAVYDTGGLIPEYVRTAYDIAAHGTLVATEECPGGLWLMHDHRPFAADLDDTIAFDRLEVEE
jgi:hypothetical protein